MSTRVNLTGAERGAVLQQIDDMSQQKPISSTLTELQLVVERLTFSGLHERAIQNDRVTVTDIDLFFRDEVSEPMLELIKWMAHRNWLAVLAGEDGAAFLNQLVAHYQQIAEIQFTTAVPLDGDHKLELTQRLRQIFPEPARILFSTSPLLGAGFTVTSGQTRLADKSLRTHIANVVPRTVKLDRTQGAQVG